MTKPEEKLVVASTLLEIAVSLSQGAAGPCDFWFKELSKRLTKRAGELTDEARRHL